MLFAVGLISRLLEALTAIDTRRQAIRPSDLSLLHPVSALALVIVAPMVAEMFSTMLRPIERSGRIAMGLGFGVCAVSN